jgi:hypothetical protein
VNPAWLALLAIAVLWLVVLAVILRERHVSRLTQQIRAEFDDDGVLLDTSPTSPLAVALAERRAGRTQPLPPPTPPDVFAVHRERLAVADRQLAVRQAVRRAAAAADLVAFEVGMAQVWEDAAAEAADALREAARP